MANRKVLINRHTTGNTAPNAAEMFHGEIAVAHKTGEEILWTKNNANEMVPFISCAQTMTMIDNAISAANVSYDVKKAEGEAFINVDRSVNGSAVTFTLSSDDVQSEEEFEAYSAATKVRIDNNVSAITTLAEALSGLTDIVVTAVSSGDEIIIVTPATTGENSYSFTHKTATAVTGFNKLDTDDYGHVTAATAVATADIQALGFKTSAETGEEIAELSASVVTNKTNIEALSAGTQHDITALSGDVVEYVKVVSGNIESVINELSAGTKQLSADTHNKIESVYDSATTYADEAITAAIEALDSDSATTDNRHYITAITIEDGKIVSFGEATDPQLSVESAGTGNVVSSIAVNDHKITYQTVSVATSEDIQALSASVISLSAATTAISEDLEELSGITGDFSGYTDAKFTALSAGTLQLSADTYAAINQLSGFAHGEIVELSGAVQANETDIDNLSSATLNLSAVTLTGVSLNNTPLAVNNHIVSVPVTTSGSGIAGAAAADSGSMASAIAVKEYVENTLSSAVEYKGSTGATPANPAKGDLYIASSDFVVEGSKSAETGDFIIYDGTKWDVIEKNLDGAITGNLTQDTVTLGDSTNSVKSLANGASGQVLTIANGVPTWVDDPELSVVSAGTGNVLTDITVDDHEITFTKGVTAAADADLKTLSGMVETISGYTDAKFTALSAGTIQLSADTKAAIAALSAGTIQLSADTKAAIEQLSGFAHNSMIARDDAVFSSAKTYADEKVAAEIALLDSVGSASTTGHYLTSVTITDGKISAVGEVAVPAAVAITATTATPVDTASAVLTGVTTGGTDGHELTFGMSNKVFSASTADEAVSAVTSQSAQTSVSANMAYELSSAATITSGQVTDLVDGIKNVEVNSATTAESADTAASAEKVAHALSVSGYSDSSASTLDSAFAFDGSEAKSLTFGTNGNAGLKSMSMTSAGVVDVEVIDCGTY